MFRYFGSSDIKVAVCDNFNNQDLTGVHAVDVPAGTGVTSRSLA